MKIKTEIPRYHNGKRYDPIDGVVEIPNEPKRAKQTKGKSAAELDLGDQEPGEENEPEESTEAEPGATTGSNDLGGTTEPGTE